MEHLQVVNLKKTIGGKCILDRVSLSLQRGEMVAILGESGVGKSTLFRLLVGLDHPDGGEVLLDGKKINDSVGRFGYMPQKDLLFPYYTVLHNAALPFMLTGINKKEAYAKASSYFDAFGIEGTQQKLPGQLSGGMRQRVAFLRTYLSNSEIALLDEPFSALDTITKSRMHGWLLEMMHKMGYTALLITHDVDEAILLADRIYILAGSPARMTSEIQVQTQMPRNLSFSLTAQFLDYKRQIFSLL